MTERKPAGLSWESWIDRQIREAQERGEFDNLPGSGKPLTGIDKPYDANWWVKQMLRREDLSVLPPALKLRKDVDEMRAALASFPNEDALRAAVRDLNARIVEMNRKPPDGPPSSLMPLDVERFVQRWRETRV